MLLKRVSGLCAVMAALAGLTAFAEEPGARKDGADLSEWARLIQKEDSAKPAGGELPKANEPAKPKEAAKAKEPAKAGAGMPAGEKGLMTMKVNRVGETYLVELGESGKLGGFRGIGLLEPEFLCAAGMQGAEPRLMLFRFATEEPEANPAGGAPATTRPGARKIKTMMSAVLPAKDVKQEKGVKAGEAPVEPVEPAGPEGFEGTYNALGTSGGGAGRYSASVKIEPAGKVWRVTWTMRNQVSYVGVGVVEGSTFCVACVMDGQPCVVVYKINKDGSLTGRWAAQRGVVDREDLTK